MLIETLRCDAKGLLWHYTGWGAMEGIVCNKQIWASHIAYLNDVAELDVGLNKVKEALLADDIITEDAKTKGVEVISEMKRSNFCVASFSGAMDSLSQWRAYGKVLPSIALGFDKQELIRLGNRTEFASAHVSSAEKVSFGLVECDYESQRPNIKGVFDAWLFWRGRTSVGMSGKSRDEMLAFRGDVFRTKLIHSVGALKSTAFHDEKEWRFICRVHDDTAWGFHQSNTLVVPHIAIDLENLESKGADGQIPFPLRAIMVGPHPHLEDVRFAVELFLRKRGLHQKVDVIKSAVPYRNW